MNNRQKISERAGNGSRRVQTALSSESKVEQHHKNDVDINAIVKRFTKRGYQPPIASGTPMYGDFSDGSDYQESVNRIISANAQFDALPSEIRTMFDNDPANLLDFVDNPDNAAEAFKLGLIPVADAPPPSPTPEEPAGHSDEPVASDEPPDEPDK